MTKDVSVSEATPLTGEELRGMFGDHLPMEAVELIWPEHFSKRPHFDPLHIVREKLRAIALRSNLKEQPVAKPSHYRDAPDDLKAKAKQLVENFASVSSAVLEGAICAALVDERYASRSMTDEPCACPICAVSFKPDDMCLTDIEMGTCHAACLEGSPMVYLDTGEPLPEGEKPEPYRYASPSSPVSRDAATDEAISDVADITARAKAMNLGMAKYYVSDIEKVLADLKETGK